jgi:hypothetical protein
MKSKLSLLVALLLACSFLTPAAQATVLRVVNVQTDDVGAYVKELERGQALLKKMGATAILRVWRARYAGPEAGSVVVSIEYPDLVTFANEDKKVSADADYQAWLKGLQKIRKVVSDSLYEEMKSP